MHVIPISYVVGTKNVLIKNHCASLGQGSQTKLNSELLPAEGKVFTKMKCVCIKMHATCFFWQRLHIIKQVWKLLWIVSYSQKHYNKTNFFVANFFDYIKVNITMC